jgi:ribosome-associated protein
LVETKRGTKRGSSTTKKPAAKSARPLIHSSHGVGVARQSTRNLADAGDEPVSPAPRKRLPARAKTPGAPGAKVTRPRMSDSPLPRPAPRARKPKAAGSTSDESVASDSARELAISIAAAALDKKAVGLEVLDVAGKVDYADFLVLMTGRSDRQVQALAQGIEAALRDKGRRPLSVEGLPHASWVLMDFGDVVVHVFQDDARSSYDLDGLWMDARRIPVPIPDELR